ncbi:DUF4292 domain-containing protein [Pedobacter nanyangensis]|uniref:DUF4292 domain-containing protein n=1 Tax=Pedobacter nanyangensis TaxID=1562389 RepID=UPI000DE49F6E|nr:DUF4292 domain-containing protein [Pedobacter nanyangensis]
MRKNILNSGFLIACVVLAVGCAPKKEIIKAPPAVETAPVTDKKSENLATLLSKELPYSTLSLKGKAELDINGDANNVTLNIRIKKDEVIWFNVTALGGTIEAARGIITPDSLWLMNRFQKTILRKPLSYIHDYTNQQVNFGWLQAIIVGNTIPEFMTEKSDLKQENGVWILSGTAQGLAYRTLFNTLLKAAELNLNDAQAAQALKVVYDKYTPVNKGLFPSNLKITSAVGNKKISVAVEFTKIDANVPVEFPFTVPKTFQLIH